MDHVETMAYTGETPWHGLGHTVPQNVSTEEMLKASGLDWDVSLEKIYLGNNVEIPKQRALVRSTDKKVLTITGSTYKITQNSEVFDFFRKFVEAGDMTLETAGSLKGGQYVWCLAKIKKAFTLGKDDEVESYLLFSNPHIYGYSRSVKYTSVRVVCWNTLNFALGARLNGKNTRGATYNIPHSIAFNEKTIESVHHALGLANTQHAQFEEAARAFAKTKLKKEDVDAFFGAVLKFDPETAKQRKDGTVRVPSMLGRFQEALEYAPGHDLRSAKGTLWGALNAVTYVIDHEQGRSRDNGLAASWFGYTGDIKRAAFEIAVDLAKKK